MLRAINTIGDLVRVAYRSKRPATLVLQTSYDTKGTTTDLVFADPDPKAMQKAKAEKALTQFLELTGASKRH